MAPYRAVLIKSSIVYFQGTTIGGIACTAITACAGWLFGDVNLALVAVAFASFAGDLTSGALRAYVDPEEGFTRAKFFRGVAAKFLAAQLFTLGVIIDWAIRVGVPGAVDVFAKHMPWTRLALMVLIATEASSMVRNIRRVQRVPKVFADALDAMAKGDPMAAVKMVDAERAPDETQIGKRWSDTPDRPLPTSAEREIHP